jgi:nucleoside-diphosphate-sugar epimerase
VNKDHFRKTDRILITGGTGFMGSHLAQRCLQDSSHVFCLGFTGKIKSMPTNKHPVVLKSDLLDKEQLHLLLADQSFDYVFNLSGYIDHTHYLKGGRKVLDAHFTAVMNLIDCLDTEKLRGFVQVGSSDEYGGLPAPQKETMRERPISPYSMAKTAATYLIETLASTEGFPGVVVRPFLVYGPGQDMKRLLPQIIVACLKNEEFKTSEGKQLRDFCYVEDVADAMVRAAIRPGAKGHVINLGSGEPIAIRDVVRKVMEMTGGGKPLWGKVFYRPGENMALYPDIELARDILGWSSKTSFEEGLRKTIAYCQSMIV